MTTTFNYKEIMNNWRRGVKGKMRGIANFTERIQMRMDIIDAMIHPQQQAFDDWQIRECYCKAPGVFEWIDEDWRPFKIMDKWGREGGSAFFRRTIEMPRAFKGEKVALRMYVGGDGLLSLNGKPFHALDPFHHEVLLVDEATGEETFDIEIEAYVSYHADQRYPHPMAVAELITIDQPVRDVYWDILAAVKVLDIEDVDEKLAEFIRENVWEALKQIPLQETDAKKMREAILAAGKQVRDTVYATDRFVGKGLQHLVGHSHLDIVFMWPYREFVRKIGRTHTTMLRLMEQYPEFQFCQSQAKMYADMKEHFPDVFEEVKKRVKEGRWELIGAFWVEPDCNLISGESFVRQILHGQKFFEQEFGFRSRTCWQPDVFGLSWSLPQVLARAGIEYFLTNKMMAWNDTNPWQHHNFWWEGMDGSRVLGIVPPGHFIGTVDPDVMDRQWRTFNDKETIGETLHIYGWGDGGGGPDIEMIECGKRYADFPGLVKTRFSGAEEAFDSIKKKAVEVRDLPVIRDEIYLEAHRGTYTNKGKLKKLNRRLELLYREAEMAACIAMLDGASYPSEALDKGWKIVLTEQFHDSLPGTHINEVEPQMLDSLEQARGIASDVHHEALDAIVGRSAGGDAAGKAKAVVLFNSLLHDRDDFVQLPAKDMGDRVVLDDAGKPLPQQKVACVKGCEHVLVRLKGTDVPGVGTRVLKLGQGEPPKGEVSVTETTLENAYLKVTVNRIGEITSIHDKENNREVLVAGERANRFQMYEDTPGRYQAWDIAPTYYEHEIALPEEGEVAIDEQGPLRCSLMLTRTIGQSTLQQRISLCADSRQLHFETEIDWVERQRLLKVAFPVNVRSREATYDIAFGNMTRPTHRNDSFAAAKFEVCAHQWMDLSQADYGVSLLNDCKYGHECHDNVMRLTLLKGALYPDPEADLGKHHFTYVLYPHAGDWRDARTNEAALNLNNFMPARLVAEAPNEPTHRFIHCDNDAVTLEAVKLAEDGEGIVLRLVERRNTLARGTLTFDRPVKSAAAVDLMEENGRALEVDGAKVRFEAGPYEIVTLRVRF